MLSQVGVGVRRGEIVSLVGPSGWGKSTLLRIVGGLDTDYQGRVEVLDRAPRLHVREIGFVFQEPRLPALADRRPECRLRARRQGRQRSPRS